VAELYAGVKGDDEHKKLDDFIDLFPICDLSALKKQFLIFNREPIATTKGGAL